MKWLVLVILIVALVVVLSMLFGKKKSKATAETFVDLANLGPMDARRGDTVTIVAMGRDYDDLVFTVDRVCRYEADGETWDEVSGHYHGQRVFMESWDDDGVRVCVTKPDDEIEMAEVGLGEPDLIRLDESGDTSVTISALGVSWRFDGSGEVLYREPGSAPEGYYAWTFEEVDGPRTLTIEKWEGEPFEALISHNVPPGDVQVLRA